ncbi:MAG: hypothetical protein GX780_06925 [Campylobacteraceae bacterium]|nr:hypothetical protein [Campylobacteraceae bacterium]
MKALKIFSKVMVTLGIGLGFVVAHGVYTYCVNRPSVKLGNITKLGGNPLENNTLYFRYFEFSDYMSGHFYFPGAQLLGHESFTYRVKHNEY